MVSHLQNAFIIVMVTTANKQEAENIAQNLLEARLIACANILGPISSHFHWEGKIERAEEYLLLMKSRSGLFKTLAEKVRFIHSYEVPEVIAVPIVNGSAAYLNWLGSVLK